MFVFVILLMFSFIYLRTPVSNIGEMLRAQTMCWDGSQPAYKQTKQQLASFPFLTEARTCIPGKLLISGRSTGHVRGNNLIVPGRHFVVQPLTVLAKI